MVKAKGYVFFQRAGRGGGGGGGTVVINMVRNASVSIVILAYLYISPCKIMVVMEYCMNLITIQWRGLTFMS